MSRLSPRLPDLDGTYKTDPMPVAPPERPMKYTKEDYLKIIAMLDRKEALLLEQQKAYFAVIEQHGKRVSKAEKKREKAKEKLAKCNEQCARAEAEIRRLECLVAEMQMLVDIFRDAIPKQQIFQDCVQEASRRLNDVADAESLIARYEATEQKRMESLRRYDEVMEAKALHVKETQDIIHKRRQMIGNMRDQVLDLTEQLQRQNLEHEERKQQQQVLEQTLIKQKIVNSELYAAIDNIYKSVKAPQHYFEKAENEDILRLLNGMFQLVPLVKDQVEREKQKDQLKSLSGAIGAPSKLPELIDSPDIQHQEVAVAHKLVETARRLQLIANVMETQEAIVFKYKTK